MYRDKDPGGGRYEERVYGDFPIKKIIYHKIKEEKNFYISYFTV